MDINLRNQEADGQMSHFDRLPEELISLILSMTGDLKFLCQCLLVSKGFAHSIHCIKKLSFSLPAIYVESGQDDAYMSDLLRQILNSDSEELPRIIQSSHFDQKLKFFTSLVNFVELGSINLEFRCQRNHLSPLLNWKAKCNSEGAMVQTLVSLIPSSVHKTELCENEEEHLVNLLNLEDYPPLKSMLFPLKCCREWLLVACLLIKSHHSLERVMITDSHKHGKLVLKGEEIAEYKKSLFCKTFSYNIKLEGLETGWIESLNLPESGYVMKGVLITIMRFLPGPDFDDLLTWEFDEEEEVFGEAVREILMKHRDEIFIDA